MPDKDKNKGEDAQVLDLLLDSLEQSADTRETWLATQIGVSDAVKEQVLRLLAQQQNTILNEPFNLSPDDCDRLGEHIGDYRLRSMIGRGGMGVVYLAERIKDFDHVCAIKLIRNDGISANHRAQFVHERQILAEMKHPYIAHLLDGGTTSDGDDYFVMEWIEGVSITDYCNQQQFDLQARLKLFCKVCQAIEYSHSKLLVHGDIKPNNILVTKDSNPHLLDFGIAQYLERDVDNIHRAVSRYFASPEQLQHQPLTVAADIYSLCTLLQVLLCENADNNNPQFIQLAPECKAVIDKGRAQQPDDRYANISQLLDDCLAFQRKQPVDAYSDHWSYRSKKFMQRHWPALTAASVILLLLVSGIAVSTWQANVARYQKQQSEQFSATLVDVLTAPDPYYQGNALTVEDMLDRAKQQLFGSENELDTSIKIDLLLTLAKVYINIDKADKAEDIERQLRELTTQDEPLSLAILARIDHLSGTLKSRVADFSEAENYLLNASNIFEQLATFSRYSIDNLYELGALYLFSGEEDKAKDYYVKALNQLSDMQAPWTDFAYAQIHNDLGIAEEYLGELAQSKSHYELSLQYAPPENNLATATQLANLASVERKIGNTKAAIDLLHESLEMHYAVVGKDHIEVSMILSDLAWAYVDDKQARSATEYAQQALNNALAQSGRLHRNTAAAYFALGNAWLVADQLDNAQQALQQALNIRVELLGEEHVRTVDVAISLAEVHCKGVQTNENGHQQLIFIIAQLEQQADNNRYYLERAKAKLSHCQA